MVTCTGLSSVHTVKDTPILDTQWSIYTEDKGDITKLISQHFNHFSVFQGVGYWFNQRQLSCLIVIVGNHLQDSNIRALCEAIAYHNNQGGVLCVKSEVRASLIQ